MTPKEFQARIQRVKAEIEAQRPAEALRMATDGLTLTKRRVQGSGTDATGKKFEGYTPIYAKYGRKAKGYQAGHVDFTRQGRMWASIHPEIEGNDYGSTEVVIKAGDAENQAKLNGQFKPGSEGISWNGIN